MDKYAEYNNIFLKSQTIKPNLILPKLTTTTTTNTIKAGILHFSKEIKLKSNPLFSFNLLNLLIKDLQHAIYIFILDSLNQLILHDASLLFG